GQPNPESKRYIADGLLRCGLCNGTMRLRHARPNKAGKFRSFYECYWHRKSKSTAEMKGREPCKMFIIPAHIMDSHLFELRLPLQLGLVWEKQYEDKVNTSVEPELARARQRVENIKNSIAANETAMTNNDRTQYATSFDPDKYNARNNELNLERANFQRELVEAEYELARYQKLFESEENFVKLA